LRAAFAEEIESIVGIDERAILLSGDIGNRMFDSLKEQYPNRFYNFGVAEANMTSVAAGLAMCGHRPVTYTITAFNTIKCLEQIRVDVCLQSLPVIIVGVGGGLSYSSLNPTHHALEDIACMRSLPNMTVVCPGDAWEVRASIRAAFDLDSPVYIRLAKKNEPLVHEDVPDFTIGRGMIIKPGEDICLINCGSLLPTAVNVTEMLANGGVSAQLISMPTAKPLDVDLLSSVFSAFSHVFTLEEHSVSGGFGGAVAEWLADQKSAKAHLMRIGTDGRFMVEAGDQEYARKYFGITANQIVEKVLQSLRQS
jgi:transketolase